MIRAWEAGSLHRDERLAESLADCYNAGNLAQWAWKLVVTTLGTPEDALEAVVSADNWLSALRAGRKEIGEDGGVPQGASCVMSATGDVTILDAKRRRRYVLVRAVPAGASANAARESVLPGGEAEAEAHAAFHATPSSDAPAEIAPAAVEEPGAMDAPATPPALEPAPPAVEVAGHSSEERSLSAVSPAPANTRSISEAPVVSTQNAVATRGVGDRAAAFGTRPGSVPPAANQAVDQTRAHSEPAVAALHSAAAPHPRESAAAPHPREEETSSEQPGSGPRGLPRAKQTLAYSAARAQALRREFETSRALTGAAGGPAEEPRANLHAVAPEQRAAQSNALPAAPKLPEEVAPRAPVAEGPRGRSAMPRPPRMDGLTPLAGRDVDPTPQSPLTYRERAFLVPRSADRTRIEALLQDQFTTLRRELAGKPRGQLIHLAVFDHSFDDKPLRPPIATLEWRDWRGDAVFTMAHDPVAEGSPGGTATPPPSVSVSNAQPKPAQPASPTSWPPATSAAWPLPAQPAHAPATPFDPPVAPHHAPVQPSAFPLPEAPAPVPPSNWPPPAEVARTSSRPPPAESPRATPDQLAAPRPTAESLPKVAHDLFAPSVSSPSSRPPPGLSAFGPAPSRAPSGDSFPPAPARPVVDPFAPLPARPVATDPFAPPAASMPPVSAFDSYPPIEGRREPTGENDNRLATAFEAMPDLYFLPTPVAGLDFTIELVTRMVPSEAISGTLYDINADVFRFVTLTGPGAAERRASAVSAQAGLFNVAKRELKEALVIPDISAEPRYDPQADGRAGLTAKSLVYVPMRFGGQLLGMLQLINREGDKGFSAGDVAVLSYVAAQFAEFLVTRRSLMG